MGSETTHVDIDQIGVEPGLILDGAWVAGRPRPKGSLKPRGYRVVRGRRQPILAEEVEGSTEWRAKAKSSLARQVKAVWPDWRERFPLTVPVEVYATFCFAKPADPVVPGFPCGMEGDLDKLQRNLGDAMKDAGLIADDRLIVLWHARKRFMRHEENEGAIVSVRLAPATAPGATL
jgi:Holliday junction resolvase RusA-like endonuclease